MPILRGHDSKGPYYKVYRTKIKYHYLSNNEISRKIAHTKARKMLAAIKISQLKRIKIWQVF